MDTIYPHLRAFASCFTHGRGPQFSTAARLKILIAAFALSTPYFRRNAKAKLSLAFIRAQLERVAAVKQADVKAASDLASAVTVVRLSSPEYKSSDGDGPQHRGSEYEGDAMGDMMRMSA